MICPTRKNDQLWYSFIKEKIIKISLEVTAVLSTCQPITTLHATCNNLPQQLGKLVGHERCALAIK